MTPPSITLAIYSSGSVPAQKLLMQYVARDGQADTRGKRLDLRDLFDGWFDLNNAGPKARPESYKKIAEQLGVDASTVCFFSDNPKGTTTTARSRAFFE